MSGFVPVCEAMHVFPFLMQKKKHLRVMLSPTLGCVQRSVRCLSQFATHFWQSEVDFANCISGLYHSTCGANKHRVRSIHQPPNLPSSIREFQRAQTAVGWLQRHPPHSFTELCQGNNPPSHISFVCCLAVLAHRKPTVRAGLQTAHATSIDHVCWHFDTRS